MRRRVLTSLIVACVLAVAVWFGGRWVLGPVVVVAPPERGQAVAAVYATGTVEPVTWAKVQPLVSAQIVAFDVHEGQPVHAGDVLARLDDAGERARLAELEAKVAFLEKDAQRYRRLAEDRTASLQTWERVASDLRQAQATVAAARERVADFTIVSPIDGEVLRRDHEVGEVVGPDDVIFWIGERRPLHINAEVDEEDIPRVRTGQSVLIKSDAFVGQVFEGTVERITPLGDPVNKSFRVYVALPEDSPLRIGMTVELNIVSRTVADTWLVPVGAVRDGHVFIVDGGRAHSRPVVTGIIGQQKLEILKGVTAGDRIITHPPADLADDARVRPRTGDGEAR